jgi:ABC-type multidrug transport system fused ATPase/permease subunit
MQFKKIHKNILSVFSFAFVVISIFIFVGFFTSQKVHAQPYAPPPVTTPATTPPATATAPTPTWMSAASGACASLFWPAGKVCQWGVDTAANVNKYGAGGAVVNAFSEAASAGATAIAGSFLAFSAYAFDYSAFFALQGTTYGNAAVQSSWLVLRDVVNIVFIFLILYIGLQTILGLSGANTQKALIRVVIVALLINFSFVITGIVVDSSNVITLGFYDAFPDRNCVTGNTATAVGIGSVRGLSCPFAQAAGFNTFFGQEFFSEWSKNSTVGAKLASGAGAIAFYFFFRMAIILIAAFVLFAAAIMFIIRIGMLLILMILSPLAAAAWALPKTEGYAKDWLDKLLKNAFFAPIFMLLYYVSARLYLEPVFVNSFTVPGGGNDIFAPLFIKFAIVAIMLVATLIISQKLGARGASYFVKRGKKYAGTTGQYTIGRVSSAINESDTMKRIQAKSPRLLGNLVRTPFEAGAKATFGGDKGGYVKRKEEAVKRNLDNLKYVSKDKHGNDLIMSQREVTEEEWVDKDGKPVSKGTPGARELLRNADGKIITKETAADGSAVWREDNKTELKNSPYLSLEKQIAGYSQHMRTVREDTKASDVFTEKLAAQRRKTEYGILGAVFPSTYKRDGRGFGRFTLSSSSR